METMQENHSTRSSSDLEKWIDEYSRALLDRAYYLLSDKEDAKDVVQEVFLAAFKNGSSFEGKSSPLTWLMGILHHKIMDIYKKYYKEDAISLHFEQVFDKHGEWNEHDVLDPWELEEHSTSALLNNEEFCETLSRCIDHLPRQWRMLVNLCYLQEQKAARICEELNLSSANYWKLLQRSRLQLRECIDIHWFKM